MKLIGYVDGVEVRFDFYPPSTFKAEIPKQIDGTYIIQLQAVDDAGNKTGYSNIFIEINFDKLTFKVLNPNFTHKLDKEFEYAELQQEFSYKELM